MARKTKKELKKSPPISKTARLIEQMVADKRDIDTATGAMSKWRYIDFANPRKRLPSLTLEWLFGSRGLLAGRIMQLRATFSKGKSSFMYLNYAMAQLMTQAFCLHIETEGAQAPADYVAGFGADPDELMTMEGVSLEGCLESLDDIVCRIRGGFAGDVNPETGRVRKSKYTDPIDPDCEFPIVCGIDSLSSLGKESETGVDVMDVASTSALSYHARKLREYFRNRVGRFRDTQTLLMLASHETAKINTGGKFGGGGGGGDSKSSIAQNAVGGHATWGLDVESRPYRDRATGKQLGDIITLYTFKNKISPRYRKVEIPLIWDQGFDLIQSDWDFLTTNPASPFVQSAAAGEKLLYKHGHGITCKPLSDSHFANEEEFLYALYSNADLLASIRESLRIRGCGFAFEQYVPVRDGEDELTYDEEGNAVDSDDDAEESKEV